MVAKTFDIKLILKRTRGIVWISITSIIFITLVEVNLYSESERSILEVNNQIANKISLDIENNMEKLDYINRYINEAVDKYKGTYDEEVFLDSINKISNGSLFKYIGIVDKKGYLSIGSENEKVYVGDRVYFKKSIDGKSYVSEVIENRLKHELDIVYSRPLVIEGKTEGIIVGVEPKKSLQKSLVNNAFLDKVKVDIVDFNGNIVIASPGENRLYESYIKGQIEDIKGRGIRSFKDENGDKCILVYNRIKNNDWYVVSVAPLEKVFVGTHNTIKISMCAILLALVLYIILATCRDIKREEELKEISYIDTLTNLRNLFKFKLDCKEKLQNKLDNESYCVVVFDIRNFKAINDMFGYGKGDKVLKGIAENIKSIEFENISARIGEDVFTLAFKIIDDNDLEEKIKYINESVSNVSSNKKRFELNTNIGVFKIEKGSNTEIEKALDNANVSRIESKQNGDRLYYLYNTELEYKVKQKLLVEKDLKNALINGEFNLLYQPKVDINTEKIVSAEALIRWYHKDIGFIPPDIFIPIAERNGDINVIGRWVIKEVCKELRKCIEDNKHIVPIAINLSRVELYQANLIEYIKNTMKRYNIPKELLEFEITETAALNDIEYINNRIKDIKKLGVKVSMDDFGTGSSTLCNLKILDIDTLKIDRSMSIDLEYNEKTKSLLKAIINLAKEYRFDVVCEGIENRKQVEILKELKCDIIQGYTYYKPLGSEKFEEVLCSN